MNEESQSLIAEINSNLSLAAKRYFFNRKLKNYK